MPGRFAMSTDSEAEQLWSADILSAFPVHKRYKWEERKSGQDVRAPKLTLFHVNHPQA